MHSATKKRGAQAVVAFTEFPRKSSLQGEFKVLTLQELAEAARISYKKKDLQPLLVPDALPGNNRASGTKAIAATCIFLDFDKPKLTIAQAAKKLLERGAAYCIYPTYSWTENKQKYRVVLPLAAPATLEERKHLIARIAETIPGVSPETYDNKRGYYLGRNGTASPEAIWNEGTYAEAIDWPDAETPKTYEREISLRANPAAKAQELHAKLGRKLKDGDGRWSAVEHLATRVVARKYGEEECHTFLNDMIARYFDPREVQPADRRKWEARILYWQSKERLKPQRVDLPPRQKPDLHGLPETFNLQELAALRLEPTQWIIEDLLPPGLTLLVGPPKVGKSQLALIIAMCAASGTPFLGRYAVHETGVTYYDLESGHHLLQERALDTMRCMGLTAGKWTRRLSFSLVSDQGSRMLAQLRADLLANPATRLLIVDVFAKVRSAVEESQTRGGSYLLEYELMRQFQDICTENPRLALVLVHHTNKRGTGQVEHWQDMISGTQAIIGAAYTNILMSRPPKNNLNETEREKLKRFAVLNAVGKRVKDILLTLEKTGDGATWKISEMTPDQVAATGRRQEIMAVLASDPNRLWSSTEVHAVVPGSAARTVAEIMRRMAHLGQIVCPTGKGYCLPQDIGKEKTRRPKVGSKRSSLSE